jgi:hypothetical protein
MGMLEGKVVGDVMAIKIAEIGAQGEERTFTIISRDESGNVSTCNGSYGYMLDDGTIFDGDVRNTDLEKALPIIKETGVVKVFSMVRGHFKSRDGKWLHIDAGFGNHFLINDAIAREFLSKFAGQPTYNVYMHGVQAAMEILKKGDEQ